MPMKKWYELAKAKMKADRITQEVLAVTLGVTQGAVAHWLSGRREPSLEMINNILETLALPRMGISSHSPLSLGEDEPNVEYTLQPTRSFSYPEISWVQAGSAMEVVELSNIAACPMHASDVWAGENGFWLKVVGSSMTNPSGPNSFPEGFLILVAPDIEPHPGQYVVARMIDSNEATFKQLVSDAGDLYLKPLNPLFPMKELDDSWEMVGTVVDGKMPKSIFV